MERLVGLEYEHMSRRPVSNRAVRCTGADS
jgi:hypothetical protein